MIFPVDGQQGKNWKIIQGFSSSHPGIDIAPIPAGKTDVACRAPEAGKVVASSKGIIEGNYVIVQGSSGLFHYFGHFSVRKVSVGQSVAAGQTLGILGKTGEATGVHTHWETRPKRKPENQIDPLTIFQEEEEMSKPTKETLRIIHAFVAGWDIEEALAGKYDKLFNEAAGWKEVNQFVYEQFVSHPEWRDKLIALQNGDQYEQVKETLYRKKA